MKNYITGYFQKKQNGRLELMNTEVTSGFGIEYFNRENEDYTWKLSRIEHNGEYYIYHLPGIDPTKVKVRIEIREGFE